MSVLPDEDDCKYCENLMDELNRQRRKNQEVIDIYGQSI